MRYSLQQAKLRCPTGHFQYNVPLNGPGSGCQFPKGVLPQIISILKSLKKVGGQKNRILLLDSWFHTGLLMLEGK